MDPRSSRYSCWDFAGPAVNSNAFAPRGSQRVPTRRARPATPVPHGRAPRVPTLQGQGRDHGRAANDPPAGGAFPIKDVRPEGPVTGGFAPSKGTCDQRVRDPRGLLVGEHGRSAPAPGASGGKGPSDGNDHVLDGEGAYSGRTIGRVSREGSRSEQGRSSAAPPPVFCPRPTPTGFRVNWEKEPPYGPIHLASPLYAYDLSRPDPERGLLIGPPTTPTVATVPFSTAWWRRKTFC
jgi:hypothetical protein